jgi:hypothetical protein
MRSTFKRQPGIVSDGNIKNTSRYFNQMEFHGTVHNDNYFEADQFSFMKSKNLYVDNNNALISRDPLRKDSVPNPPVANVTLKDIKVFGNLTFYVWINDTNDLYWITTSDPALQTLEAYTNYHITAVDQYIIVFNNINAQVVNTLKSPLTWEPLTDNVEIPITSRTVGGVTTEYPTNGFTTAYKEQYVWSNQSHPTLPEGDTAEVDLVFDGSDETFILPNANILTDYRVPRKLNFIMAEDDLFSTARGIICIGRADHFMISYDDGVTFSKVFYPLMGTFLRIASISRDGNYFFVVATDAVYRCNLGDHTWVAIYWGGDKGFNQDLGSWPGVNNICCFLTGDVFSYIVKNTVNNETRFYMKGPGFGHLTSGLMDNTLHNLATRTDIVFSNDRLERDIDCDRVRMMMSVNIVGNVTNFAGIFPTSTLTSQIVISRYGTAGGTDISLSTQTTTITGSAAAPDPMSGSSITVRSSNGWTARGIRFTGLIYNDIGWYRFTLEAGISMSGSTAQEFNDYTQNAGIGITIRTGYPYQLTGGWIIATYVMNTDLTEGEYIPDPPVTGTRNETWVSGDYWFMHIGDTIWTNRLSDGDIATLTYSRGANDLNVYTNVPDVSYSDTELYMGFGQEIQITANVRDGVDIKFNLPAINDHVFIDDITALINVSNTEVAAFFKNQVYIISRVEDPNFGYRYDYYKTKLSVGVRLGDDVINTLEGNHTIFATRRGLSVMGYQSFMATTDQQIEYITDNIRDIWYAFYDATSAYDSNGNYVGPGIKILQMGYWIFLTNGTKDIIVLDLRYSTWWFWQIPLNIKFLMTDQETLRLLADTLYRFEAITDTQRNYRDFPDERRQTTIDWYCQSQPLHFKFPNHYKNLRQLVFTLQETNEAKQTSLVQIKLFRKLVDVKEPEIIDFKIDEYKTFVKRFNYWRINAIQWGIANDPENIIPAQLKLNGVSVKYELGEEVR